MERSVKAAAGATFAKAVFSKLLYLAVFLVLWQLVIVIFKIKVFVIPSPIEVFEHMFNIGGNNYPWWKNISATVTEVAVSFVITAFAGIFIAILVSWSRLLSQIIMPIITLFNTLPKIAVAPLFLLWFGYGLVPNVLIAFLSGFFPIVINTLAGMNAVDKDLLDRVKYLNASKLQIFVKIKIPNSLPYVFAGLKISATLCVVGCIVGEFLASEKGLGYLLKDAQAFIDTPTMFACLFLLSLIGMLFFSLIRFLESVCMPWNKKKENV